MSGQKMIATSKTLLTPAQIAEKICAPNPHNDPIEEDLDTRTLTILTERCTEFAILWGMVTRHVDFEMGTRLLSLLYAGGKQDVVDRLFELDQLKLFYWNRPTSLAIICAVYSALLTPSMRNYGATYSYTRLVVWHTLINGTWSRAKTYKKNSSIRSMAYKINRSGIVKQMRDVLLSFQGKATYIHNPKIPDFNEFYTKAFPLYL